MQTLLAVLVVSAWASMPAQTPTATANDQNRQPPANNAVQQVEESLPFGSVSGKLVTSADYLIFIDEKQLESSFVIDRGNVQNVSYDTAVIHLTLKKPVRDRSGAQTTVSFRFLDPRGTDMVVGWMKRPTSP